MMKDPGENLARLHCFGRHKFGDCGVQTGPCAVMDEQVLVVALWNYGNWGEPQVMEVVDRVVWEHNDVFHVNWLGNFVANIGDLFVGGDIATAIFIMLLKGRIGDHSSQFFSAVDN
eukprot:9836784-Ditylum_brightwellii.AAC.1